MNLPQALPLATFLLLAFAVNLPFGYLREGSRKYSLRWFLYIHLSIPFIVAMRLSYGFGWGIIPFSVACAVLGQLAGGRLRSGKRR